MLCPPSWSDRCETHRCARVGRFAGHEPILAFRAIRDPAQTSIIGSRPRNPEQMRGGFSQKFAPRETLMNLVTAFTSIVGLLGVYKDEVRGREGQDFNRYIDWVRRQEHHHLVDLILNDQELSRSIRVLVEDEHGEVMARLRELDKTLSSVASHMAAFKPLADAMRVKSGLSDQAISILQQSNRANASHIRELRTSSGHRFNLHPADNPNAFGTLEIAESRFIEDDFDSLCQLGLLRQLHHTPGRRVYRLTRAGAAVGNYASCAAEARSDT